MSHLWPWATLALLGAYHGVNPGMGWLFAVSLGLQERSRKAVIRAFAPIAAGHFLSIAAVVAVVAALQTSVNASVLRYCGAAALVVFGVYKLVAPMSHPRWVGMRVGARQLALWSFLMATAHGAGLMVVPVVLKMNPRPAVVEAASTSSAQNALPNDPTTQRPNAPTTQRPNNPTTQRPNNPTTQPPNDPSTQRPNHPTTQPPNDPLPACHVQVAHMAGKSGPGVAGAMAGVGLHTLAMFVTMGLIALLVYDRIGLRILRTAWYNLDLVWAAALIAAGVLTAIV